MQAISEHVAILWELRKDLPYEDIAFMEETEPEDLMQIFKLEIPDDNELFDKAVQTVYDWFL